MKKLLFLILAVALVGCKGNEPKEPFKIDPLATVNIKPEKGAWKLPAMRVISENPQHLSALEIVKQTTVMQYYNPNIGVGAGKIERMFDKLQRDTISETPALKMWATDIINDKGEYVPEFIEAHDIIFIHFHEMTPTTARDTIGYIPNSTIRSAQSAVKSAYDNNDPEEVLRLFNEAFTFRPITGAEYKALKEAGNQ
ncbi:MAG: hypothetical protein GX102_13660 [Porphyromonadaceae bacterium]|nr:hypothetical protein [Porphyromonadaceae bacterium]